MAKVTKTNIGDKGGLLVGKPHNDKNGNPIGGIKAKVVDTNEIIEVEGKEAVINPEASKKNWRELSKINQSIGGGVPIIPPSDTSSVKPNTNGKKNEKDIVITDDKGLVELKGGSVIINKKATEKYYKELSEINQSAGDGVEIQNPKDLEGDVDEYKRGGTTIQFNPNNVPSRWVYGYAKKIKKNYPEIWDLGGNIYGNEAFENLERVIKRGYWLEGEEWFYVKWQSFNARHKGDFLIAGVIANLKWLNKVEKGWDYMKNLIEAEIEKRGLERKKMALGGELEKGIKAEQEHNETYKKIYNHEVALEDAPRLVAEDHLKENDHYYTKLFKMEGMEYGGKIAKVMREFKEGKLETSYGEKVTDEKQAIAIALSEQRKYEGKKALGGKVFCENCGHSWHREDNHTTDVEVCHKCGHDNRLDLNNTTYIQYVETNKVEKMEKSDIFYNPEIFKDAGDYILGGFNASDLNGIEVVGDTSFFNMAKLKLIFEKRLENAIENYKLEIIQNSYLSSETIDKYELERGINGSIKILLQEYLGVLPRLYDTESLVELIVNQPCYNGFLYNIEKRVEEHTQKVIINEGNVSKELPSTVSVSYAEACTYNVSLMEMLEQLSNIIETNNQ
jgi:hypothetical protein